MTRRRKKGRLISNDEPMCMWAIHNFPTALKNRFAAYCKANGHTIVNYMEYLIARELKINKVDIPPLRRCNTFVFEQLQIERNSRTQL